MRQIFILILALCASVVWAVDDVLSGKFTVNTEGRQVQFAPGNLQKLSGTLQFAASQTEIVGVSTAYASEHPDYTGTIDLFTWDETNAYANANAGWRLLTNDEWDYLLREEEIGYGPMNAGQATIGTQHGLMLVPDGWSAPSELTFEASPGNWTTNRYTQQEWETMETSGAVFLPCVEETGSYWSATTKDESKAYGIYFYETAIQAGFLAARSSTFAVRLVKDVEKGDPTGVEEPTTTPSLKGGEKVLRDGQIVIVRDGKTYTILGQEK